MENSRTCGICNVNVHRASYAKHMISEKHLQNIKQGKIIIPEWLFKEEQAPFKKLKKVYNPKTLKTISNRKF